MTFLNDLQITVCTTKEGKKNRRMPVWCGPYQLGDKKNRRYGAHLLLAHPAADFLFDYEYCRVLLEHFGQISGEGDDIAFLSSE